MVRGRWRTLSLVLAAGALFDAAFGAAILLAPAPAAALLRIDLPADPVHLRLNGVLLLILAALYALAAREPERFHAVAPVSACGRALGSVVLAAAGQAGAPKTFLALAASDLVIGLATALAWAAARRASPSD